MSIINVQYFKVITLASYIVVYYHHNILLGVQQSVELLVNTGLTINAQSLIPSDHQHHSVSPSK